MKNLTRDIRDVNAESARDGIRHVCRPIRTRRPTPTQLALRFSFAQTRDIGIDPFHRSPVPALLHWYNNVEAQQCRQIRVLKVNFSASSTT